VRLNTGPQRPTQPPVAKRARKGGGPARASPHAPKDNRDGYAEADVGEDDVTAIELHRL